MAALSGQPVQATGGGGKETVAVNLKELYREITVRGGLEEVITTAAWKEIERLFFRPISHSAKPHK
jgi:hypothetical protein